VPGIAYEVEGSAPGELGRGSVSTNAVPLPRADWTSRVPPIRAAHSPAMYSPRPVPLGARIDEGRISVPCVALGVLGVVALVFAVVAIVSAAQWALLALAIVVVALWAGTTIRHAVTPPRPLAVH
jgi:hypothetical protein